MASSVLKHKRESPLVFIIPANGTKTLSFNSIYCGLLLGRGFGGGATCLYYVSGYGTSAVRQNWFKIYDPNNWLNIDLTQSGTTVVLTNTSTVEYQYCFINYMGGLPTVA